MPKDALDTDPFALEALPHDAEQRIVSLASIELAEGSRKPGEPIRHVCRAPGGLLYLVDVSGEECCAIGKPTTHEAARALAAAVLACEPRALTDAASVRTLALAYCAAVAQAERRHCAAREAYRNKEMASV